MLEHVRIILGAVPVSFSTDLDEKLCHIQFKQQFAVSHIYSRNPNLLSNQAIQTFFKPYPILLDTHAILH